MVLAFLKWVLRLGFAGLVLAGLVTAAGRKTAFYRVAFFVPVVLPMLVIAVLWSFVYSDDIGLINGTLRGLGLDSLTRVWLGDPSTALIAVSLVSGWIYAGFYMAIFYAALMRIPKNVLEAAIAHGVKRVVCLSTDKAVYPINAMGISKAMMEKVMVAGLDLGRRGRMVRLRPRHTDARRGESFGPSACRRTAGMQRVGCSRSSGSRRTY